MDHEAKTGSRVQRADLTGVVLVLCCVALCWSTRVTARNGYSRWTAPTHASFRAAVPADSRVAGATETAVAQAHTEFSGRQPAPLSSAPLAAGEAAPDFAARAKLAWPPLRI